MKNYFVMDLGTDIPSTTSEAELLEWIVGDDDDWVKVSDLRFDSAREAAYQHADYYLFGSMDDDYHEEHLFAVKDETGHITFFNADMKKTIEIEVEEYRPVSKK